MEITVKQAVEKLTAALKSDPDFFFAYQSNIAMPFFDKLTEKGRNALIEQGLDPHQIANDAANFFLELLCENAPTNPVKSGAELIAEERREQIVKHGFDVSDDDYKNRELLDAALQALGLVHPKYFHPAVSNGYYWPWDESHYFNKLKAKDDIGLLKVCGAFCAAEIDRIQREQSK